MRLVVVTDIHGHTGSLPMLRSELQQADVLIAAGDLTHFGGQAEADEVLDVLAEAAPRLLVVSGNCDTPAVKAAAERRGVSIECALHTVAGIQFLGLGGSLPCPGTTPQEYGESEYREMLAPFRSTAGPLVLVSHQPPYDTKLDMITTGLHVGSTSVRSFIEAAQPLLCISGHIHEAHGVDQIGATRLLNPGPLQYGGFAVVDIDGGEVTIQLKKISRVPVAG